MIVLMKKPMNYVFLILIFCLGFLIPFCSREPRVKLGDYYVYCNPRAKINLRKIYHLSLWDYKWPIGNNSSDYQSYLNRAIRDFRKTYPNIHVKIRLLDMFNGPVQLEQALKSNNSPDVYCSAYRIPAFNYKRQIPVGPYLKSIEKEEYFSGVLKTLDYQGVLCSFPRWATPGLWIGNKALLESAGLSLAKIQSEGWAWEDLLAVQKKIPAGKILLVGNLGSNGLFTQLVANSGLQSNSDEIWSRRSINATIDFLEPLIRQKAIPADCDRNILGHFLKGKAALLAGVRPSLYNYIIKRLKEDKADWQAVLVPIPTCIKGKETILIENSTIAIYRNKRTSGDDHLVAAIRFGQFLSSYQESTPWEQLMVYPTAKAAFNKWLLKTELNSDLYKKIAGHDNIKNYPSAGNYQIKVYPLLNEFVEQKISGTELKAKLNQ